MTGLRLSASEERKSDIGFRRQNAVNHKMP